MEAVADGVWLIRGGTPRTMNVYLIEGEGGVTLFDAGISVMAKQVGKAAATLGGIKRIVLGHSHADHRGAAAALSADGVPVLCHELEVADAISDGGAHYFHFDQLQHRYSRALAPYLLKFWDGGPVPISDTLAEGDNIAGFDVIHLPGHAPGLIGLWRERDRLALVSDTFYTVNPETARRCAPTIPHRAFNMDTEMARASALKLSALNPKAAWPGHTDPVLEDVAETLAALAA